MKLTISLLFSLLSLSTGIDAQRQESLYIQTDRNSYAKGETIYFKGYIIQGTDPVLSNHLFVEIWDSTFNKLAGIYLPIIDATASGSITIPSNTSTAIAYLRAYTDKSAGNNSYQYVKPVLGIKYFKNEFHEEVKKPEFFPEGGMLLYNVYNYVAFRSPENFSGQIWNSKGSLIGTINPIYKGFGVFKFRPVNGVTYFCKWISNQADSVIALPLPAEDGVAIHTTQRSDTLFFDLDIGTSKELNLQNLRVQLMIDNQISYVIDLKMNGNNRYSYFIPLRSFIPGMAELRVLDDMNNKRAGRPVLITGTAFNKSGKIDVIKKDLGKRGENHVRLKLQDTLIREIAVSVTDAAFNPKKSRGYKSTLLSPALSALITESDGDLSSEILDLMAQTLTDDQRNTRSGVDSVKSAPANYLKLKGVVKSGKKIVAGKEVLVSIRSQYTGSEMYKVTTNEEGQFLLDGLIFYGEASAHCRIAGKNDEEVNCDFEVIRPAGNEDQAFFEAFKEKTQAFKATQDKREFPSIPDNTIEIYSVLEDTLLLSEKGIMLKEVIIEVDPRKQALKRLEELEKKYLAGTGFAGYSTMAETVDVLNDPSAHKATSIFTYIAAHFHMIKLKYVGGRPELFYLIRGINGDTIIRSYYINDTKTERLLIDGIHMEDIALIKFIPMLGMEFGMPPAVVIFLKKPNDIGNWENEKKSRKEKTIYGYPVFRDLLMPEYRNMDVKVESDTRKTLLWQPYIKVVNGVADLMFYNNDVTKKIRIVAEGITRQGNTVFFEKVLE